MYYCSKKIHNTHYIDTGTVGMALPRLERGESTASSLAVAAAVMQIGTLQCVM